MKSSYVWLRCILVVLLGILPSVVQAQTPPLRIMPLGDSITFGASVPGGYRNRLYQLLTAAGYNVDFVGNRNDNGVASLPDSDHQGIGGWRIDQVDSDIAGWFGVVADPDVILVHIGTNDFGQNLNTATAIDRLDALITKLATLLPSAHIIVTNLMERTPAATNDAIQAQFNPFVQARVNAQVALGRRVTFLNMRAAVPLAEMPDGLHPGQAGYDHMADAWLPAIQAVASPLGDNLPPAISRVRGNANYTQVAVTFSKAVADSAADPAKYSISGGLTVSAATLDPAKRVVTLTTSTQTPNTTYTVTVNGVTDVQTPTPNALPPNTNANFTAAATRGYAANVAESNGYTLLYSLDVPNLANYLGGVPAYTVDYHLGVGQFDRVAYYLELQRPDGALQYAWVSMNAFTTNPGLLGVPTLASGAIFQQGVTGLNVVSNVAGVTNASGVAGNLEFWATNYESPNDGNVPGADGATFDFGDRRTPGTYGSMQIHNTTAAQTVIAFNNWGGSVNPGNADIGIGNDLSPLNGGVDWTFHHNAADYTVKTLQVLVREAGEIVAPAMTAAEATFSKTKIYVRFVGALAPSSILRTNFVLDQGVTVVDAALAANQRDVVLVTTPQPDGTPLTLTVNNVRGSSGKRIAANSTMPVTNIGLPPEVLANVGAAANGYQLIASIDVPVIGNFVAGNPYTFDDRSGLQGYSRVAYYLELQKVGEPVQYIWTAMDAFASRDRLGVPTQATGTFLQKKVQNLDVLSNVAGIATGTGLPGGNVEFWPSNYVVANDAAVPGANANTFDFGDGGGSTDAGYGSMQVHNSGAGQTLFAINHFGTDGQVIDVGIGNNPAPVNNGVDWTFAGNAGAYSRRVLHVLGLPAPAAPALPAEVAANIPAGETAGYELVATLNLPATGNLTSGAGFTDYAFDRRGAVSQFTRVAYYIELQKSGDATPTYVWTAMDAFTADAQKIGVPNLASKAFFQQKVTNLNIFTNSPNVTPGTNLATGNIEFWPSNYGGQNDLAIPNASPSAFDFGDGGAGTGAGYGSMQVHNYGASQTLFAINNWGAAGNTGNRLGIGIGNNPTPVNNGVDWTFADNAAVYNLRKVLHILVKPGYLDRTGPTVTDTLGSATMTQVAIGFNENLSDPSADPANFTIPGLTVTGARLAANRRDIILTTSAQTPQTVYTVNITGVRDRSPLANLVAPGTSTTFTSQGGPLPAILSGVPEASGYKLVYQLPIPIVVPQWNVRPVAYSVNEARFGEYAFDRVAYAMELDGNYVYTSFDRHTDLLAKIGVPTPAVTTVPFQQKIAHLNVASNVGSIVTGTDIATGNIEFWSGNYNEVNALSIPNANGSTFDFGDNMTAGGHGSMQVHNHGASQTLFAYNNWGTNTTGNSDLGIGNAPSGQPDWTFAASTANYATRNLYVLARPGGTPTGVAPIILTQPTSRIVLTGGTTTLVVSATGVGPLSYQWRFKGTPIGGATNPWLDLTNVNPTQTGAYDVVVAGGNFVTQTSQAATVTVNTAPVFAGYSIATRLNTPVIVTEAALLAKVTDPDFLPVTVTGAVTVSEQGGFVTPEGSGLRYTPKAGFLGVDRFRILFSDQLGGQVQGDVVVTVTSLAPVPAGRVALGFRVDGKLDVMFSGTPGQTYRLQRNTVLTNAAGWTTIQTVVAGDDGAIPFTDLNPPADKAFYRVLLPE